MIRYLIADVDDTLTFHGRLEPQVLAALSRCAAAGIQVILNTGRSAGWGAALLQYLPGISAVIAENGGAWFDRGDPPAKGPGEEIGVHYLNPPEGGRARLFALREKAGRHLGLDLVPTADDAFRLTDHTVVRTVPGGPQGAAVLSSLRQLVKEETAGQGDILASSVHIHFFIDGPVQRSKAVGVAALLRQRGIADPAEELGRHAVAVGDSGNDISLFVPGRFALSAGVRNIERYLPELGECVPRHVTRAAEGAGLIELIDDLLSGRL